MIRARKIKAINRYFMTSSQIRWGLLVFIAIVLTISLYPRLVIKKHRYEVGDVAQTDVKASENFFY